MLSIPAVEITCKDNDGSSLVDIATERAALVSNAGMKNSFRQILDLLAPHFGFESGESVPTLTEEEAKERRKNKEKILRARIAISKKIEEQKKLDENQKLVDTHYTPLDRNLIGAVFTDENFHPEFLKAVKTQDFSKVRKAFVNGPKVRLKVGEVKK